MKRPCAHSGCPNLVHKGFCDDCAPKHDFKARTEARRESASARGYDRRWQKARLTYLRRNPLCADPFKTHERQGMIVAAVLVDHIQPHKGDMTLFWRVDNWQPLCKECHDRKTAQEDGGWGRGVKSLGLGPA